MATLSDLKLTYRIYMKGYRYRSVDWRPGTFLSKPLAESKLAVVTTASYHLPDQQPFDEKIRGGDYSYRELPVDCDLRSLRMSHRSDAFDDTGLRADSNLALPLDRLRELVAAGEIGYLSERHFTIQGSIPAPGRLVKFTAPEIAAKLKEDAVDAVLLTPVCPLCHQSAGLIQSVIEREGIPTVSTTVVREVTDKVKPPRALFNDRPFGYPLGEPGNAELQTGVIRAALALLSRPVEAPLIESYLS